MSDTLESLRRKINGAGQLRSVVHSMKVLAASSISQYEKSVLSLTDYSRAVNMGLAVCYRKGMKVKRHKGKGEIGAIIFGSDQGLIGQFNDVLVEFFMEKVGSLPGRKRIWTVGERAQSRLAENGMTSEQIFSVPHSITAITPLVGQILLACESAYLENRISHLYIVHNRFKGGAAYEPASQLVLPLEKVWEENLAAIRWPTRNLPEVLGNSESVWRSLVSEYLFVSLFKACAESLASENASRLAAMQRAEKNIDDLLEAINRTFHLLRQSSIDEELFDVISGFEAMSNSERN